MSHEEILEKAVQKAIDAGWRPDFPWPLPIFWSLDSDGVFKPVDYDNDTRVTSIEEIMYDHDFAKALWGTKTHQVSDDYFPEEWQYHLQEMVISEDPIKYLGENL